MAKLYVVGLGPGDAEDMTLRAHRALKESGLIVGYSVYVELLRPHYPEKEFLTTPMTKESDRCRMALDAAREGRTVSLVCSGDSGVYGMAGLVYELRGGEGSPEIEVVPGLTAACSAGALLGAPLTHDFAVISLSDRLTPWETIEKRLEAAAGADLSIVLYNPASRGRPEHLRRACDVLLRSLPPERLCGVARNVGREGEDSRCCTLAQLREDTDVDMFCTVFIGNASTKKCGGAMVTPRGYKDVS
ncbi:MAG: precorrin-3B C(17)-methyltransferase [Oscillospiraceae bacterium]|nr:precorrin-3B C(17)-methyltransferase [Oscillospiraceae bacterium]